MFSSMPGALTAALAFTAQQAAQLPGVGRGLALPLVVGKAQAVALVSAKQGDAARVFGGKERHIPHAFQHKGQRRSGAGHTKPTRPHVPHQGRKGEQVGRKFPPRRGEGGAQVPAEAAGVAGGKAGAHPAPLGTGAGEACAVGLGRGAGLFPAVGSPPSRALALANGEGDGGKGNEAKGDEGMGHGRLQCGRGGGGEGAGAV